MGFIPSTSHNPALSNSRDCLSNGFDFLRIFVSNLKVKLFLHGYHDFNSIQRVSAEVFPCAFVTNLSFFNAE